MIEGNGVWPVAQVRAAEGELMATLPGDTLMRRAATGLAAVCADLLPRVYGARVTLLVGGGNNGGDALYAGARLAERGARVDALLLAPERAHPGGLAALRAAGGSARAVSPHADRGAHQTVAAADLVLDGVVGIGGRGGLREPAAQLATTAAEYAALRVATDVPSGVDADTGAVDGAAFRADVTVTFGCLKPGLVSGDGRRYAGDVRLVDIGLLPHLGAPTMFVPGAADIAPHLPVPTWSDDKYTRGAVGVAAGSEQYAGAAVLAVGGAVRGGAGVVRYVGPAAEPVRDRWPESIVSTGRPADAGRVQAWVVGPGMGTGDLGREVLAEVLRTDLPVLVDADGLTLLARHPELLRGRAAPTVLTPHDREFARLWGPVGPDRIGAVRRAAADSGATVLLKGDTTLVGRPDGVVYINPTGSPWLATAGSGDVLSGFAGALLAVAQRRTQLGAPGQKQGGHEAVWPRPGVVADPAVSSACAAYVHGVAGGLCGPGCSATSVLDALPDALRRILGAGRAPARQR